MAETNHMTPTFMIVLAEAALMRRPTHYFLEYGLAMDEQSRTEAVERFKTRKDFTKDHKLQQHAQTRFFNRNSGQLDMFVPPGTSSAINRPMYGLTLGALASHAHKAKQSGQPETGLITMAWLNKNLGLGQAYTRAIVQELTQKGFITTKGHLIPEPLLALRQQWLTWDNNKVITRPNPRPTTLAKPVNGSFGYSNTALQWLNSDLGTSQPAALS